MKNTKTFAHTFGNFGAGRIGEIKGKGSVSFQDNQKDMGTDVRCEFNGDFALNTLPTTFESAMEVLENLLNPETKKTAIPMTFSLIPLHQLDSSASRLVRSLGAALVDKAILIKNYQEQLSDANISVLIESNEEKDNLQELRECLFDSITDSQKEAPNVIEKTDTATILSDSNDWPNLLNDKFTTCNKTCFERETAHESRLNVPRNIRNSEGVSLSSSFSSNADGNLS